MPQNTSSAQIVERYGTVQNLFRLFDLSAQGSHALHPERCICGTAPTLRDVNAAYGAGHAEQWLMLQLIDLSEKTGARVKMTPGQCREIIDYFVKERGFLRLTDFELFFHRVKLGWYPVELYGSVDPTYIMRCFDYYWRERNATLAEMDEAQERERREHQFDGCMTVDEYVRTHPDAPNPLDELQRMADESERRKKQAKADRERQRREQRDEAQRQFQAKKQAMMDKYASDIPP